ncbi:hypothetical protein BDR03DRAFT_933652 [Suillus americanus]|nr:hypothetical protein BDR03DRAFT_933652 [Suillus americanus]
MNPQMGYPRPINRVPPPQFLTHFHAMEENWHMTEELMAEIERADYAQALSQQPPVPGMSGVAYAGGAASGAVYVREVPSPLKDPVGDRVRANERSSPKDADGQGSGGMQRSRSIRVVEREKEVQPGDSARARERPLPSSQTGSPSYSPSGHPQQRAPSPERTSPPYHTPTGSSGGESVTAVDVDYVSYKRDSYQSNGNSSLRLPSPPPTVRKAIVTDNARVTPPAVSKFASNTPPLQAMKTRTPDKSLPVQEEPEDEIATSKNGDNYTHGSDYHEEDDNDTLIENDHDFPIDGNGDRDGEIESYTPRSPTASLPEPYSARQYPSQPANQRLSSLTKHHRNGSTDRLGLRSFDAAVFEKPPIRSTEERRESPALPVRLTTEQVDSVLEHNLRQQHSHTFSDTRGAEQQQQQSNGRPHPLQHQVYSDDQNHDDPAAAYISHYFQSPRPVAPIPPTPHSQTAAPSPLISSMQSMQASPAPPVGSPYPYPFSHVRRNNVYSTYPIHTAPSSNYDPNHPSAIEEQFALQMQMYALNNHAALSDSTFSPSSTPFPGPGYNPWAFLQASRAFGGGVRPRFDSTATMSIQSSPSHQPVSLPFPTGKIKRRQASADLRVQSTKRKIKPPPRVESTQPRDTSPEPYSSGEETAGEEHFEVAEEGNWVNGMMPDDGTEWVDEDEDEKDDLLDLEYHPNYVNNIEKRRRRWDTRWEALQQAFQALDCETDTTMVLLAAPSHSTKLHALTSRSIRREIGTQSPSMHNIRNSFRGIAARRRASRAKGTTLVERFLNSTSSGDGSDGSSESREGDLKRALETALGSLGALRSIYDHRVARWEDEMGRISDERDRVEMLLRQTLGVGLQNGNGLPDA